MKTFILRDLEIIIIHLSQNNTRICMRLLGQVEVILRDKAVVRIADVSSIPMISSSVYNERREYIGRLIDVIGPVSKPYAVVSIKREGYKPSIGESFYYTYKPSRRKRSFR